MFFGNFDNVVRVEQRKTRFLKESFRFVGSASVEFLDLDSALKFMNLPEVSFQVTFDLVTDQNIYLNKFFTSLVNHHYFVRNDIFETSFSKPLFREAD